MQITDSLDAAAHMDDVHEETPNPDSPHAAHDRAAGLHHSLKSHGYTDVTRDTRAGSVTVIDEGETETFTSFVTLFEWLGY